VNHKADGGITALHMAALHGHVECVQLLLDFGASVSGVTVEDGTTIDLIGFLFASVCHFFLSVYILGY
jgi:E3 ubiquitin-protein ligase XBAT32/33